MYLVQLGKTTGLDAVSGPVAVGLAMHAGSLVKPSTVQYRATVALLIDTYESYLYTYESDLPTRENPRL